MERYSDLFLRIQRIAPSISTPTLMAILHLVQNQGSQLPTIWKAVRSHSQRKLRDFCATDTALVNARAVFDSFGIDILAYGTMWGFQSHGDTLRHIVRLGQLDENNSPLIQATVAYVAMHLFPEQFPLQQNEEGRRKRQIFAAPRSASF